MDSSVMRGSLNSAKLTYGMHLRTGRPLYLATHWWRVAAVVYAEFRPYEEGNSTIARAIDEY